MQFGRSIVLVALLALIVAQAVDLTELPSSSSDAIEESSVPILTSRSSSASLRDVESGSLKSFLVPDTVPWYRQAVIFHLIVLHLAMIIIQVPQTPLLGVKSAHMGLDAGSMGLILAMMPVANFVTSLLIASRMTAWGLKRVLVWGAILMVASGTAFGGLDWLEGGVFVVAAVLLRILGGIGTAANFGATNTFWNTNYKNFSIVYAISNAATTLAGVIVPPLGTVISARFGNAASFAMFGAVSGFLVANHSLMITSKLRGPPDGGDEASLLAVGRMPRALAASAVVTSNLAASGLLGVFIPYLFASLSGSDLATSLMYSGVAAFWSFGSLLSGYLLTTRGLSATRLMHQYTWLSVLALVAMVASPSLVVVTIALCILAMATSLSQVAASQVLVDEVGVYGPELTAVATGVTCAARGLGEALGNFAGGVLYAQGQTPLTAMAFAALSAVSLIAYEICRWWAPGAAVPSDEGMRSPLLLHHESLHGGAAAPVPSGAAGDDLLQ